jgi:hypothetical protein
MTENEIATIVVDAAFMVHTRLGPGLLESVYEASLAHELAKRISGSAPAGPAGYLRYCTDGNGFSQILLWKANS